MDECAICQNMAPLMCDTHAELRTIEVQGYLDGLASFEHRKVSDQIHYRQDTKLRMSGSYGRDPKEYAYLKGRYDALHELIQTRVERFRLV